MAVSLGESSSNQRTKYIEDSAAIEVQRHISDVSIEKPSCASPFRMRKAKRIRFLCNGDRFYKGVVMAVAPERYRSFDSLLSDLTRAFSANINLPNGVRTVFTMDGAKVAHLDDLEDGKLYVCSGIGEQFKKVDYAILCSTNRVRPARSLTKLQPSNGSVQSNGYGSSSSSNYHSKNVVRPRIVILIRSGVRPRRVLRLLLNKRNAPSFEHALSTITDAVKLDTGAVRKIFSAKGIQVGETTCILRPISRIYWWRHRLI